MGSNGPSQNVVSTMLTLHMQIDRAKTGTAKIFALSLSLSLSMEHTLSFIKISVTCVH
jgi:hypothetical protein